ncbi:MAG: helix-turn-helix transcriptional regulator [Firmicutes bacterium]|nr:helix-turn-helix transcriptional regulator [Bacillota bacterium]
MNDKEILAKNLKDIMKLKGKKRKDISDALNIKYSTLCEWLKATNYPRIEALRALADYLGVTIYDLIGNDEKVNYKHKYLKLLKRFEDEIKRKSNIIKINDMEYIKLQSIEKIL